jgi:signal transduction histidine kinase
MDMSTSPETNSASLIDEGRIETESHCPDWLEPLLEHSEMAQRIWQFDWASTPLGLIESWPKSLCFWVDMILTNKFAMTFAWGDDYIVFYNDAFIPIAGEKHPHMLGHSIRISYMEILDTIMEYYNYLRTGKSRITENHYFSLFRFGYLEEMYASICNSPLRNDQGKIEGFLSTLAETTEQVLGERRLRTLRDLGAQASEARNVAEACRLAALALAGNPADLPFALIYLLDSSSGQQAHLAGFTGLIPGEKASPARIDLQAIEASWPLISVMTSGQPVCVDDLEVGFGHLPGGPWPESAQSALVLPLKSQTAEKPLGCLVAGISPRRRLEAHYQEFLTLVAAQVATAITNAQAYEQERHRVEELARLDQAKTAFFSNVSHEFRTPLTLILGLLEEVQGDTHLPKADLDSLDIAYRNALRLLKLVNTLLDFSRMEAHRMQTSYHPVDLAQLTRELASNFQSAMDTLGLTLVVDCPPLPEPVYVDPELWEKIVLNLLSNAIKHTFEGQIEIKLTWQGESVILTVRDTGVGIPTEHLPHLFERFYRVPHMRARSYEGTGIGLALVWELVNLHHGRIAVDSVVDQGAVFTVEIPTGKAYLPADRIEAENALSSMATGARYFVEEALHWVPVHTITDQPSVVAEVAKDRPRIVLADDNVDMLGYVQRLLAPFYEVIAVPDGQAALESIQAQRPDLVLTDVMMPCLDGFGLLRAIREDANLRTLPVIMVSARAGEEAGIEGREAGADDYLTKPFSANELLARVRANLAMAKLRQETDEKLRQVEKMKVVGQLAGGVAHDFNSLLTVLFGRLDMLREHILDTEGQHLLNSALGVAERSARLVKHILAFARKQSLQLETIDLTKRLSSWQELLGMTLGRQNRLTVQVAEPICPVRVDVTQLEMMLLNVILNARDAMPSRGMVTLTLSPLRMEMATEELAMGDYICLSISDTGEGMSPDVLANAFEPFFTTKGVGEGTGLGLSQVYGTAQQFGGTALLHSVLGQGTTVEIIIPCEKQA